MPSLIELQYNPYLPRLNILLNGKQPPDFSQLVQYTDEDIWYWCNCILDSIYSEVRDDFYIEFTGTENDTGIMRYVCSRNSHCLAFREHSFVMNDSLQKRLGSLNQFIKKNDILDYQKTIIAAYFIIPQNMQHLLEEIVSIDIGNLFCSVRIETSKGNSLSFDDGESTYLFVLTDSFTDGLKSINRIKHQNPAIIINFGQDKGFCGIQENAFCYETTEENFISTVFQCFLTLPLLLAFRKCIQSLPEVKKKLDDFLKLSLVDPQIIVSVKSRIEIDKSTAIDVTLNPPMGKIPKLDYRILNSAVAECDGCSVFGKQRGKTALEVYRYGEKKPFYIQDIEVFVRNRIKKIILSEDELILGVGDTLKLNREYVPEDADNADKIIWKSTNDQVMKVDRWGNLSAVGTGACRIICSAESVSASCICEVRPYLEDIITDVENNKIVLYPAQELRVNITLIPANCIDQTVEFISSDYDVVNIVGNTLYAKKEGTAIVTIQNKARKKAVSISVTVEKAEQKKAENKKKGFFQSLFQRE